MTGRITRRAVCLTAAIGLGFGLSLAAPTPAIAQFSISVSVRTAPPPLPYYEQPMVPGPDFVWAPGYWASGPDGYFWVPGAWVVAPRPGLLWTPGYWAYDNVGFVYGWHPGYWAASVGYYGGVNYGFGYFGRGYVGGGWYGAHFRYNTAVTNVNTTIVRNVYVDRTVVNNVTYNRAVSRVSYNGGPGGVVALPLASERIAPNAVVQMTSEQMQHQRIAAHDRNQLAAVSHNNPQELAVARPFTPQSKPASFQPIRPADRAVARATVANARPYGGAAVRQAERVAPRPPQRVARAQPRPGRPDDRPERPQPDRSPQYQRMR